MVPAPGLPREICDAFVAQSDRGGAALLAPQRARVPGSGAVRRHRNIGVGAAAMLHFGGGGRRPAGCRRHPRHGSGIAGRKRPDRGAGAGLATPDAALIFKSEQYLAGKPVPPFPYHALRQPDSAKFRHLNVKGTVVMVDNRPDDTGSLPDPERPKREPPTIDLEATEVSTETKGSGEASPASAAATEVPPTASRDEPSRAAGSPARFSPGSLRRSPARPRQRW